MIGRLLLVLWFAAALPGSAFGEGIEARNVAVERVDDGMMVNADFSLELSTRLEQALNNGVALYFSIDLELVRPRWYWFDERISSQRMQIRLSYHALSRQYRVFRGALYQNFFSLGEATRAIGAVRSWVIAERLPADDRIIAATRMRLDTGMLPKPFQVSALTDREWTLASDWVRVTVGAPVAERVVR